ncbi:MAG: type II toxin-antitoxin system HicA family toxin [Candidatus Magasanikbacteria bacterium]|nr:type II toxin-antitoxin system HicA family toxin [Candidatus Magasanikbacteria bacterium]
MSKLPALKPKQVIRALEKAGFCFIRQKGSHRIYIKDDVGITIPFHNKDLKKGTLFHIIKQSGLTVEKFLDFI